MKRFFLLILFSFILLSTMVKAQSSHPSWRESDNQHSNLKAVASHQDIEVFSAPNLVKIKINQPSEVRLFTILGKLISSQRLEPGSYEYKIETHGIYIIKTEESSCKIAI